MLIKSDSSGNTGTSIAYFGDGTLKFKLNIVFGAATGDQLPLTGSGKVTGGTGRLKGATGKITFSGHQNISNNAFSVKVKGKVTY